MSRHLSQDLSEAFHSLLRLSGQVEEMIGLAVKALVERNDALALEMIERDEDIDQNEVRIEEECLKMLALHQPVAADLRRVTTMMKINNDLERMADLACNIAQRAHSVSPFPDFHIPVDLHQMAGMAASMVRQSLDAFVNQDMDHAYQVISADDRVDAMNVKVIDQLVEIMKRHPESISTVLHCFSASRHIEQIADHATNIAEEVVYMISGIIVRHRRTLEDRSTNGKD
ncbi:MAG: phosphate signaling complex protein PhoU [Planctomycetota bacterium]|jgi:phosphate transport system protein|nr:phosphate signaling complex protein PhoU [Planctomycetota bacterium]